MSADWLEKSRLTKELVARSRFRFVWRRSSVVTGNLVVKDQPDVILARIDYRPNRKHREGVCRVNASPFRLKVDREHQILEVRQSGEPLADICFVTRKHRELPEPPWDESIPRCILGYVTGPNKEHYWICSRRSYLIQTYYLADVSGVALFSTRMGSPVWMRDDFDWQQRGWLLALWWFYARCEQSDST